MGREPPSIADPFPLRVASTRRILAQFTILAALGVTLYSVVLWAIFRGEPMWQVAVAAGTFATALALFAVSWGDRAFERFEAGPVD